MLSSATLGRRWSALDRRSHLAELEKALLLGRRGGLRLLPLLMPWRVVLLRGPGVEAEGVGPLQDAPTVDDLCTRPLLSACTR